MQITVSPKAVAGMLGTLLMGVSSWLLLDHIDHGARIVRLEDSDANDARQDRELLELRATVRDLIRLTAELASERTSRSPRSSRGASSAPFWAVPLLGAAEAINAASTPPEAPLEAVEPEHEGFLSEQADLETLLRERGLDPVEKPSSERDISEDPR